MGKSDKQRDPNPESVAKNDKTTKFMESHDSDDYWDSTEEAESTADLLQQRYRFTLDPDLVDKLMLEAEKRGISAEMLINLWLNEKLVENTV